MIAFLQNIPDIANPILIDFRDVKQSVCTGEDLDEGAEIRDTNNFTAIRLADFRCGGQV